jgi:sortase A
MQLQKVERILLMTGLVFLAVWTAARFHMAVGSRAAIAQFRAEDATKRPDTALTLPTAWDPSAGSNIDFRLWSDKRISAYQESLTKKTDAPIAILRIPKITLEVPVFNDTDDLTLDRGVGRILGTAQIGEQGNLGIAGHRDGFFRGLQSIGQDDIIEVVRHGGTDRYAVSKIQIVLPEDIHVLDPTQVPTLTLVTCFPFYFVGHAPKRYIVTAQLESAR